MRYLIENKLHETRIALAKFVGASSSEDLVFVENASDACNSVINSI